MEGERGRGGRVESKEVCSLETNLALACVDHNAMCGYPKQGRDLPWKSVELVDTFVACPSPHLIRAPPPPALSALHHPHHRHHGLPSTNGQNCCATRSVHPRPCRPFPARPVRIQHAAATTHGAGFRGAHYPAWRGCQHGTHIRALRVLWKEEADMGGRKGYSAGGGCGGRGGGHLGMREQHVLTTRPTERQLPRPFPHICFAAEEAVPRPICRLVSYIMLSCTGYAADIPQVGPSGTTKLRRANSRGQRHSRNLHARRVHALQAWLGWCSLGMASRLWRCDQYLMTYRELSSLPSLALRL